MKELQDIVKGLKWNCCQRQRYYPDFDRLVLVYADFGDNYDEFSYYIIAKRTSSIDDHGPIWEDYKDPDLQFSDEQVCRWMYIPEELLSVFEALFEN